eukprot:TRINITY_DN23469_c0_g1_i1.p1 TRINITY_DN23469_c0_g1~~TRINITY_DN23469_c0_g1_i1.p1  ORF type:complete len:800 (-),score=137.90 TRINITY_DN23469_c0_g1_i1:111-2510(-)
MAISVADLSYAPTPGGPDVLRAVRFDLPAGSRCLLIGLNGAGKSTLLELVAGRKMAPKGQVSVCGDDPFRGSSGSQIALVQGGWRGGVFAGGADEDRSSSLRVWEVLGLSGPTPPEDPLPSSGDMDVDGVGAGTDAVRESRAATHVTRLRQALRLDGLLDRFLGSLSDGERRRVELGRQLREPRSVVLLDEATTDLDVITRRSLFSFLADEVTQRGCTVVNVTHVFDGMDDWPTHVMHIHAGQVVKFESEAPRPAGCLFSAVTRWLREAVVAAGDVQPLMQEQKKSVSQATEVTAEPVAVAARVRDLRFSYLSGSSTVLSLQDLMVPVGCRCALLGLNGAGKSTLLTLLAGRRLLTEGSVEVLGLRAFHDHALLDPQVTILSSEWKRQVSELSAARAMNFKELANVAIQDAVGAGHDMATLASRMVRLMSMLGVDPTKPIGLQSDGMMRRSQIALKLLRPAKLLLVDEVTADLDVLARQALLEFLKEESEAGTAVLYCTHIIDGLEPWATHVLRLRPSGHQASLSPLQEVVANVGLFEATLRMLEEDDALPSPERPAVGNAVPSRGEQEDSLPFGWRQRMATTPGAYGNYAWAVEKGSEEKWSYSSIAPAPGQGKPTSADSFGGGLAGPSVLGSGMMQTAGGTAMQSGGMAGIGMMPGGGLMAGNGGMLQGCGMTQNGMMQGGMMQGSGMMHGAGMMQAGMMQGGGMMQANMMQGQGGVMQGSMMHPGMMGNMMQGGMMHNMHGNISQEGMGQQATLAAPVQPSVDSCPPFFASRDNATPMSELVARGIVQPEKPMPQP